MSALPGCSALDTVLRAAAAASLVSHGVMAQELLDWDGCLVEDPRALAACLRTSGS